MKIPMNWLKAYVDINEDIKTYVNVMTMSGSKVETTERVGEELSKVVVGKILSVEKHPNADKLVVAMVDTGAGEPIQIITGATNVYAGAYVPIALDGSTLAGGQKIKKGKIRGVESCGMMCSIEELGCTRADFPEAPEDGIYIFQTKQVPGADVIPLLELADDVVEFELTSNRPDCFSMIGMARESAAAFDRPLKYPEIAVKETADGDITQMITVEIQNPELCPRYIARVIKNVKIGPSPQWMRRRLAMSGVRPINNIVDITNYVMLELGQPMHAFDIDNIHERHIIVRNAADSEMFTTLDGVQRQLDSSMLVIADSNKAVAVAGIMGGENSMVTENATAILFEAACFNGPNIRVSAKKLGLRTESSAKFEKSLDPNLALEAVNRAAQLVELLDCGEVVKGMADCYPVKRERWTVAYCPDRINALLGTDISQKDMALLLKRLGIETENNAAVIPTFRPDLESEADLSEEIARLYGYDNITPTLVTGTPTMGKKNKRQKLEDLTKEIMVSMGFCEAMNYSFESPKVFDRFKIPAGDRLRDAVRIINPIGEDYSVMRTTTLHGILQSLSTNYNRRNDNAALFEVANVYLPKSLPLTELPDEVLTLTIGMYGSVDFYSVKGAVEKLLTALGISGAVYTPEKGLPHMHPGRTAALTVNGEKAGYMGEVHPDICEKYDIGVKTYIAVCNLDVLYKNASLERVYKPLPRFPGVQRDIAMLVKDEVYVSDIEAAIREKAGKLLEDVKLFDVYAGKQIEQGYKSVAYSITLRAADRTLTEDEISKAMQKILANLEEKIGARLRS